MILKEGKLIGMDLLFFLDFLVEIRKIIYTANLIENLNEKINTLKINFLIPLMMQ